MWLRPGRISDALFIVRNKPRRRHVRRAANFRAASDLGVPHVGRVLQGTKLPDGPTGASVQPFRRGGSSRITRCIALRDGANGNPRDRRALPAMCASLKTRYGCYTRRPPPSDATSKRRALICSIGCRPRSPIGRLGQPAVSAHCSRTRGSSCRFGPSRRISQTAWRRRVIMERGAATCTDAIDRRGAAQVDGLCVSFRPPSDADGEHQEPMITEPRVPSPAGPSTSEH